jgi:general secretion pathway protein L
MANGLPAALANFLRWWGAELKGLMPRSLLTPLGRYQRRLVLSAGGARFRLFAERGEQLEELQPGAEDAEEALLRLAEAAKTRPGAVIGLRFGSADCYLRTLELPAPAGRDFARILDLDLERTTPFRRDDVLTAHYVDAGAAPARGMRCVRQVIVKRGSIDPLVRRMRDLGIAPAFADCWNAAGTAALPVDLLAGAPGRTPSGAPARMLPAMASLAGLLVISALAIFVIRHQTALEQLEAQVAAARTEAQKVRVTLQSTQEMAAQIAALERLSRARVPVAHIMEELTAVMPDSAWIYDLRIDGGMVEFTGFARSAAALIPLLEQSKMFTAATLTAPVVLDGGEDKERFSIRVRLRNVPEPPANEPGRGDL